MTPTTKKLGLLMLAAVLIAALFLFRSAEPEYGGKKLSNWLRQYALYTPIDSTVFIAALDNPDDRIAVSNTISRIAPHLLTNSAAH